MDLTKLTKQIIAAIATIASGQFILHPPEIEAIPGAEPQFLVDPLAAVGKGY